MQTRFKQTSTIAQTMAKTCDKELSENRLQELRRLKERLVKLRKDAVDRQKLLQDILPTSKSLSRGLLELSLWLDEAEKVLALYCISEELDDVAERISDHKVLIVFISFCIRVCSFYIASRKGVWPVKYLLTAS